MNKNYSIIQYYDGLYRRIDPLRISLQSEVFFGVGKPPDPVGAPRALEAHCTARWRTKTAHLQLIRLRWWRDTLGTGVISRVVLSFESSGHREVL